MLGRPGRAPLAGTAGVALVAVGVGSVIFHGPQPSWAGLAHDWPIFAAGAVYAAGLARSRRPQWRSRWAAAAGVFTLGVAAYAAGRSGSPFCRPDSLWQYHGAWHVLSAAALGWAARPWRRADPADLTLTTGIKQSLVSVTCSTRRAALIVAPGARSRPRCGQRWGTDADGDSR